MSELLTLKWRPKVFSDFIGQETAVKLLSNSILQNKLVSAYLLEGEFGSGKTSIARIFSRALICENRLEDGSPCNVCELCLQHLRGESPFYDELDISQVGGVADARRIREISQYRVLGSEKKKVVVLDEAHNYSKDAFNALLKLFEEGSEHNIYFLTTTEPSKILPAIRSRCMIIEFRLVPSILIKNRLVNICKNEEIKYEEDALQMISFYSGGHVRDAIMKLEQVAVFGVTVENVKSVLSIPDRACYYELLLRLPMDEKDLIDYVLINLIGIYTEYLYKYFIEVIIDIVLYKKGVKDLLVIEKDYAERVWNLYGEEQLLSIGNYLKTLYSRDFNVFIADLLLLKALWENRGDSVQFKQGKMVKVQIVDPMKFEDEKSRRNYFAKKGAKIDMVEEITSYEFAFLIGGRVRK